MIVDVYLEVMKPYKMNIQMCATRWVAHIMTPS